MPVNMCPCGHDTPEQHRQRGKPSPSREWIGRDERFEYYPAEKVVKLPEIHMWKQSRKKQK